MGRRRANDEGMQEARRWPGDTTEDNDLMRRERLWDMRPGWVYVLDKHMVRTLLCRYRVVHTLLFVHHIVRGTGTHAS